MEDTNQPQMPPQIPQPEESAPPKDSSKNLYILFGGLMFLVIGTGSFVVLSQRQTNKKSSAWNPAGQVWQQQNAPSSVPIVSQNTTAQPTPIISPVTSSNVDQTLNNTDSAMQQSIDQANSDLNKVNSIDQTQDSTNGL